MRRWLALTLVVVALGLVSACGGSSSKENAQTLPPAPALTVPGGAEAPPVSDTGTTGTTGATGATGSSSPSSSSGGSGSPTSSAPANTVGNAGGGAQAPSSTNKQSTTAPSGGAQAPSNKGLSDFCKQNPGAC
jgi:hypothetical protein